MDLAVNKRTVIGKKVKDLRKEGIVPGVVYSKHLKEAISVQFEKNVFLKVFKKTGTSTPMTLIGDDLKQLVLVHHIDLHPVSDVVVHVDFLAVRSDEKVTAEVKILLEGKSLVEKDNLGRIQLLRDTIEVEAFPQDLPHDIKIDVSKIVTVNDVIFIKDIDLGAKVKILEDGEQPLVTVVEFSDETETVAPAAAAATPAA